MLKHHLTLPWTTSGLKVRIEVSRMKDISEFLESGVIEAYVLGLASLKEMTEVELNSLLYPEVKMAIDEFSANVEKQAFANAIEPNPLVKPLLMATIDYMKRMSSGEEPSFPLELQTYSRVEDYNEWLKRSDMVLPANEVDVFAKIIGFTPKMTTAIVWIKEMSPQEIHHDEFEKFLIVEGSCTITIEAEVYQLKPGDFLTIPLHKTHVVKVTSSIPCKAILQRVAA